ncbi:MAG: very short patch repair endonuclease [Candidatus Promineofilum sp.]|nr:very short patch repair endonuclease [Promineifilum sp.]
MPIAGTRPALFVYLSSVDKIPKEKRSAVMRRVRSKDTKPELIVRRLAHKMGYRYRLHAKELPGRPDMVFSKRKKIVFVHGCMWHGHEGCPNNRRPHSRQEYWIPKLEGNKRRDVANMASLNEQGWDVLVIWECEVGNVVELAERLAGFLGKP